MTVELPDPLIARVAAADPLAERELRGDLDRERAERARRRRAARRRRRIGGAGALLALGATLAVALLPSGGLDSSAILGRAVKAAELPPSSILAVVEEQRVPALSGRVLGAGNKPRILHERARTIRRYTWVRSSASGRLLGWRELVSEKGQLRSDRVVSRTAAGRWINRVYDSSSGHIISAYGEEPKAGLSAWRDARVLIEQMRARGSHVRMFGMATIAGHRAFRFKVTAPKPRPGYGADEVDIDATTYRPLRFLSAGYDDRSHHIKSGGGGTQILSWRVLPDTPRNRRFLQLGTR